MGGEMIYILNQRLKAQNVTPDKSVRILNDAVKTMFLPAFVEQLFEPQKIFSIPYTKQIFHKIVHSSIMTLNETSMSKLFDLMLMGFKYQIMASNYPQAIYQITLNHLDGISKIIKEGPAAKMLEHVKKTLTIKMAKFNANDFLTMRRELLRYMQDRVIRVSVFLQDELQSLEGRIYVENRGFGNVGQVKPGQITYFKADGKPTNLTNFLVEGGDNFQENKTQTFLEPVAIELGFNIYEKERVKKKIDSALLKKAESRPEFTKLESSDYAKSRNQNPNSEKVKQELNLLATLIKGTEAVDKKETLTFNLFPDSGKKGAGGFGGDDYESDIIVFDTNPAQNSQIQNLIKSLDDAKVIDEDKQDDDPDDLLALMDSAN